MYVFFVNKGRQAFNIFFFYGIGEHKKVGGAWKVHSNSNKVAIRGISPMIWRRFQLSSETSLADLHHIIQISMGWDDDHLHQFKIYAKNYGIHYAGGPGFRDDAHLVFINQFEFAVGDRFTYEYNFSEGRLCDIRIEKIEESETETSQPKCIDGSRIYHEYPVREPYEILIDMVPLVKGLYRDNVIKLSIIAFF
jgi:hypothetical protein